MRISTSQIFSQSLKYMNSALSDVSTLNMMNSSQKKINNPSDDPAGMGKVMDLTSYQDSLSGYVDNCDIANNYLSLADQVLLVGSENITAALELTEQASTETYTTEQLQMMAEEMESYLDSLVSIANTQMGSDSIFAGNDLDSDAYEYGLGITQLNDSLSNASFAGFEGETDTSIEVQFTSDGEIGTDELDYQYSTDNGATWITGTLAAGDTELDLGTCQVDMLSGTEVTAADDDSGSQFVVREALYYVGSDTSMSVDISQSSDVDMTTVGSTLFGGIDSSTGEAYEGLNLFETISDCIVYMEQGDYDAVAESLETLSSCQEQYEAGISNVGARENKVTYTESSLSLVQSITTNSISLEEDADAAQILVELEQANYVYEAVLSSSASIMEMSILSYL
ncbi:flagellar hook-associated protein FlgL [Pseudodesulfovibrio piezophilus]|uniref:Flagellar hook-associated protein 3 n=1 Tax=Pseudodesulfovibrio piezophilus (strain DSM 21447 / JCM 15486 / C1TLV30) TaxID=1322246 RepID=M1WRE9_PSEP2|nr:flagellar hook-associated protein FlgL [Pseudodesulfovibrio piezophilus]CCH49499.1 Flagellar hook-associated protein 3 [Pseudodesulfovibrio piezophilus C1TLV30]